MKRYGVLLAAIAALWSIGSAQAGTLCVGPQAGCFAQIQPAVAAANDGDTITVAAGTYTGGITIDKSIRLQGAGAHQNGDQWRRPGVDDRSARPTPRDRQSRSMGSPSQGV